MSVTPKLTVLVSGKGTTLHAILKAVEARALNAQVYHVISNKKSIPALDPTAIQAQGITQTIPNASIVLWDKKAISRADYDRHLAKNVLKYDPQLIILAGFMHILGPTFFETLNQETNYRPPRMINLHPALPGQFPGANGIRDAYQAYQRGEITFTGSMVHEVVQEIDAGPVLGTTQIPIYQQDTLEDLEIRMKYHEKGLLLNCIQKCLSEQLSNPSSNSEPHLLCRGKVRNIWNLGYQLLALEATNRTSSFDRAICEVPLKGAYLTQTAAWWFEQTQHIIPNHLVYHVGNLMIVKKCRVIPIEVVIRGYITGSTQTSLWTHYQRGERTYCGIEFPNNLKKNEKLSTPVVTPTTKSHTHDQPISAQEIIEQNIVTKNEWQYIEKKALELFKYASDRALRAGYILADTKLEFGFAPNSDSDSDFNPRDRKIILIDEAFTPDSSRYWRAKSYPECFQSQKEPECLDKDLIRHYVNSQVKDPYDAQTPIPPIPQELIQKVRASYHEFFWALGGNGKYDPIFTVKDIPNRIDSYFHDRYSPTCLILVEDDPQLLSTQYRQLRDTLESHNIFCITEIIPNQPLYRPKTSIMLEDIQESIDYNPLPRKLAAVVMTAPQNSSTTLLEMTATELSCPIIHCLTSPEQLPQMQLNLTVANFQSPEYSAKFVAKILI